MTIAELVRAINSYQRRTKEEAKEKAANNYILAELIGRSVSRIYSSSNKMPPISEVYPSLFDGEEIEQAKRRKKEQVFSMRLKQFANSHNEKWRAAKQ